MERWEGVETERRTSRENGGGKNEYKRAEMNGGNSGIVNLQQDKKRRNDKEAEDKI